MTSSQEGSFTLILLNGKEIQVMFNEETSFRSRVGGVESLDDLRLSMIVEVKSIKR